MTSADSMYLIGKSREHPKHVGSWRCSVSRFRSPSIIALGSVVSPPYPHRS
ncbi:hypothetical protein QM806_32885 [Rhodococcus sp. IEGM 1351]|uniref:hypothetical protein n=1 Tax=Rhodococcus sp. IEGM 1351 TaxID=3047089 RepID=UPI0024B7B640|nr:hypothetical protein [Rhodococcus sp. IEGM 1351]MDI9940171.1 hypothetical protein [Rhodococcus sp. IEGM 1351]